MSAAWEGGGGVERAVLVWADPAQCLSSDGMRLFRLGQVWAWDTRRKGGIFEGPLAL